MVVLFGRQAGHAERARDVRQRAAHVGEDDGLLHPFAQAFGHPQGHVFVGIGQDHHHFLATIAHGKIRGSQGRAQHLRGDAQGLVARLVAVRVVETLEMVEVYHHQRQRRGTGVGRDDHVRQ
ncbi:hypothetical protein D3C72_1691940 [compost metagenome]